MKDHYDPWYVRLPDGRTIKAKSTTSVRHHIEAGHIPLNSMVRRDSGEEWVNLVWVAEFADFGAGSGLLPPSPSGSGTMAAARSGVSARLDPLRLQTVGVRGLLDELIAAMDSALTRSKMTAALVAAVLLYLGMYACREGLDLLFAPPAWVPMVASGAFAVLVLSTLNAILAKLAHLEVSTMRPARFGDAVKSLASYLIPVISANAIIAGSCLGLLFVLLKVPQWTDTALQYGGMNQHTRELLFTPILVVVYVLSALLWLVVGLCWLLTPAIVVEESSWLAGIREWRQLLRDHFGRVVVYEGLTGLLGMAVSLPLSLAVGLALYGHLTIVPASPVAHSEAPNWVMGTVRAALHGLTAGPLLALLAVANVFIYLNLRYEHTPAK